MELDLANVLRGERRSAELQHLEGDFYRLAGKHIASLERDLEKLEDHFSVEAQIIEDELKSSRKSISKLIDLRIKKIAKKAMMQASSSTPAKLPDGMTEEEVVLYQTILEALTRCRENILSHLSRPSTERPLTGKKDIAKEYIAVRLLDTVPMFVGVDGKRYALSKDDVVMLPKIHARNLCSKNIAVEVRMNHEDAKGD
ncbi:MAG: hypothetical protein QHG98_04590 [Methanothrix sp.]|jgi:DNA replication factor GINS|uniref:hypothetical protein n=1 Tax=Methanothrix sp. TaxID=90426 RepID=UPI00247C75B5|nr:hypothetical protein [Methanothrix sp.]